MTWIDSDLTRARAEAALAGEHSARLLILSTEIDRLLKDDRQLREHCGSPAGDGDEFDGASLEKVLQTIGHRYANPDGGPVPADPEFLASLLQRAVNRRTLADAREEREAIQESQRALSDADERYRELFSRWLALHAQHDPDRILALTALERGERDLWTRSRMVETADASADEAERALEVVRSILHDSVDWLPGDPSEHESDVALLRVERLAPAGRWLTAGQVALLRARRALEDVGEVDAGGFQADLLEGCADLCLVGLARDLTEQDGVDRALRPVTRTLSTVRALRGHLARLRNELREALEDLQRRREKSSGSSTR